MSNISYTRLQNQEVVDELSTDGFIKSNPERPTVDEDDGIFEKAYVGEDAVQHEDEKYMERCPSSCEDSFAADAPLLVDDQDVESDVSPVAFETASGPDQAGATGPSPTKVACTHFLVSVNLLVLSVQNAKICREYTRTPHGRKECYSSLLRFLRFVQE